MPKRSRRMSCVCKIRYFRLFHPLVSASCSSCLLVPIRACCFRLDLNVSASARTLQIPCLCLTDHDTQWTTLLATLAPSERAHSQMARPQPLVRQLLNPLRQPSLPLSSLAAAQATPSLWKTGERNHHNLLPRHDASERRLRTTTVPE